MIRRATHQDIKAVVEIFGLSFQNSIKNLLDHGAHWQQIGDFFIPLLHSPYCYFYVAENGYGPRGYLVVITRIRSFWWEVLRKGYPLTWLKNLILGRYGIGFLSLIRILWNKVSFFSFAARSKRHEMAQILSIGIHPEHRRQGYARALLKQGLSDLKGAGVPQVKLEVRPENIPAQKLYQGLGFSAQSDYQDSQGRWLVMVKELSPPTNARHSSPGGP